MPETTRADFLGHLEASHLLTDEQLATVREAPIDASAMVLADKLLSDGLLTGWQAPMLLSGYDKFFLGKYKLLDHIGQGGMGTVLKAEHAALGRVVAIKVMAEKLVQDAGALARFRREIQAAAALNHPNIVTVYDADEANGMHFLVMEYVDGEDLGVVARRQGRLPLGEACEYMRQAAAGLQHAHEQGMVHRDIKPSNFLLMQRDDGTRVVKILDMGLARFTGVKSDSDGMTQTEQIMGTPDYISPEQARSTRSADIRSDIYSLGCSLFRLLTGRVPFEGENAMEKLMARSLSDAPRISQLMYGIPPELDAVVAKMLARDPNARYQTPAEVASALAPFAKLTDDETLLELSASGGSQPPVVIAMPAQKSAGLRPPLVGDETVDAGFGKFLDGLASEAAADSEIDTQPLTPASHGRQPVDHVADDTQVTRGLRPPLASPQITKAGAKLQQQIGQRKRTEKKRLVMIVASVIGVLALLVGFIVWRQTGQTTIVIDWPLDEREDATLEVDGRTQGLAKRRTLKFPGPVGKRTLTLSRVGYESIKKTFSLKPEAAVTYRPRWKATAKTQRKLQLAALTKRVKELVAKSKRDGITLSDLDDGEPVRAKLQSFIRERSTIVPDESQRARELLRQLPWPVDLLKPESVSAAVRKNISWDELDTQATLVTVLGESRLVHWDEGKCIAYSPDGKTLVSGSEHELVFWDAKTGNCLQRMLIPKGVLCVRYSRDGKFVVTGETDRLVIRQATTGKPVQVFTGFDEISSIDFDANNERLVVGDKEGNIVVWSFPDLSRLASIDVFDGLPEHYTITTNRVRFRPDGEQLVVVTFKSSTGTGGEVTFWNPQSGKFIARLPNCERVHSAEFTRDGKSLVIADWKKMRILDARTRMPDRQWTVPASAYALEFSTDGKQLISALSGNYDRYIHGGFKFEAQHAWSGRSVRVGPGAVLSGPRISRRLCCLIGEAA